FASERIHQSAMDTKQALSVDLALRAHDDGFATAARQARKSILVCHAAREAQAICDCIPFIAVDPEAGSAHGRTKSCAVNENDPLISGAFIDTRYNFFIAGHTKLANLHGRPFSCGQDGVRLNLSD